MKNFNYKKTYFESKQKKEIVYQRPVSLTLNLLKFGIKTQNLNFFIFILILITNFYQPIVTFQAMSDPVDYNYQIPIQQFLSRFRNSRKIDDLFNRGYTLCLDSLTNKRAILKFYSIETKQQEQAVTENLQNFIKLNSIDGICKLISFSVTESGSQLISAFEYDPINLNQYVKLLTSRNISQFDRFHTYIDIMGEIQRIILTGVEIGIEIDDINRQTIIIKQHPEENHGSSSSLEAMQTGHIINIFYDERQKQYIKVQNNMMNQQNHKIYWSVDKIQNQCLNGRESISQEGEESIYQLGLMMLDIVYEIERHFTGKQRVNSAGSEELLPDQIAIHTQRALSYYQISGGGKTVQRNEILVSHKLNFLISSNVDFLAHLGVLLKNMIMLMIQTRPDLGKVQVQLKKLRQIANKTKIVLLQTPRKSHQFLNQITKSLSSIPEEAVHLEKSQTLKNIPLGTENRKQKQLVDSEELKRGYSDRIQDQLRSNENGLKKNNSPSPVQYRKQVNVPLSTTTLTSDINNNKFASSYDFTKKNSISQDEIRNSHNFPEQIKQTRPNDQNNLIDMNELLNFCQNHHETIKKLLVQTIKQIEQNKKTNPRNVIKKQYVDKSSYYGLISQESKREGLGIYIYKTGDVYFGVWNNNTLTNGTYVFKNGESFQGTVIKGGKQGTGVYRYSNGNIYDGEWKDDLKHGKGAMYYPNKAKYVGEWVKGKKHGQGIYFYENGIQYRGNFALGKKYGNGLFIFSNGTKVEGFWENNHLQGFAKISYHNGDYYEGNLHFSEKNGEGIYKWSGSEESEVQYRGQFKKDNLEGFAIIKFRNGQIYEGKVKNGKRDGQGNYRYSNGDQFKGQWKNDHKQIGKYNFSTGEQFEGKFKDGQMSFGTMKYTNGEIYQGQFLKGERHGVGTYSNKLGQIVFEGYWARDQFIGNKKN